MEDDRSAAGGAPAQSAAPPAGAHHAARPAKRAARRFFVHPVAILNRLLAEHATPRSLGAASAYGVIVGAFPFIGLHTVMVIFGAQHLRLNRLMALAANQICFPPVVPAICIEAGYFMRHGEFLTEVSMRTLWSEALDRFWEWALGACVVGPVLAVAVGAIIWGIAALLQRRGGAAAAPPACGPPA